MAHDERPAPLRAWAMALLIAVYAAGAYHAWQAAVPRHALPAADHLQQLAAALPAADAAAAAARGLCASPGPALQLTLLPDAHAQRGAVEVAALADDWLRPALAQLAGAASVGTRVALLPPPLPSSELKQVEARQLFVLPSAAVAAWVQQLQQVAWEAGGSAQQQVAGQVLLYVPRAAQQPLLLESAAGSGAASGSLQLSDGTLLLVANLQQASSSDSSSGGLEAELAQRILAWLLQPLTPPGSRDRDGSSGAAAANATIYRLQHGLAGACAADAVGALQRVTAAAAAAREQPVTAGMAATAAQAAELLQVVASAHARRTGPAPLAAAQRGWAAAQQLLRDPASGAHPAFPPEHAMAVLLPLSLPVTLVLVQAMGRQASAWKQRRRQQQQQQAQQSEGQQSKGAEPDGAGLPAGSKS